MQHWILVGNMSGVNEHYMAVLADLRGRRLELETQIQRIDAAINGLLVLVGQQPQQPAVSLPSSPPAQAAQHTAANRFSDISVRWGVLWYLADFAEGYVKTAEIADALLKGGYKSEAARFPNLVSAVLSTMKAKEEVEASNDDGASGYRLTEKGRQTWAAIRQGHKFKAAKGGKELTLLQ